MSTRIYHPVDKFTSKGKRKPHHRPAALASYWIISVYFPSDGAGPPVKQNNPERIQPHTMRTNRNRALFDNRLPVIGSMLRRKAIARLLRNDTPDDAVKLAHAAAKGHPESGEIITRLLQLSPQRSPGMHAALWSCWKQEQYTSLKKKLRNSTELEALMLKALEQMTDSDEHSMIIFTLWHQLDNPAIAELIRRSRRHAPSLELDTLFGLAEHEPDRYLALDDPDCSILEKALLTASPAQKQRINTTILNSRSPRLVKAYDRAAGNSHNPELVIDALMSAEDHDGLFEQLRGMPFPRALDLIAWWSATGARPSDPARKATVERVTAIYQAIPDTLSGVRETAPPGTQDALLFWQQQNLTGKDQNSASTSPDPLQRAGALHHATYRNRAGDRELRLIAATGSWPEQLVARLHLFSNETFRPHEHVCWLQSRNTIESRLLSTILPGTVEESQYFLDRLDELKHPSDGARKALKLMLEIITTLQGHFLAGVISVDDHDDAPHDHAIETENAEHISWES